MQVHDSEPKWCATPFLCGSLIRYSMPVYLGASLITLSARTSTFGGIVRPICLAVFRLMMNANLVGCSTGRSAGFAPFRILSTYLAAPRDCSKGFGPYDMRPPASANTLSGYIAGSLFLAAKFMILAA